MHPATAHCDVARGTAVFDLGPQAEKWAAKISGRHRQARHRPEHRVAVLTVRDEAFVAKLRTRGVGLGRARRRRAPTSSSSAPRRWQGLGMRLLAGSIKRDSAIWTITPKGAGSGHRHRQAREAGLVALKVVSCRHTPPRTSL
jgi:hypothetical protein